MLMESAQLAGSIIGVDDLVHAGADAGLIHPGTGADSALVLAPVPAEEPTYTSTAASMTAAAAVAAANPWQTLPGKDHPAATSENVIQGIDGVVSRESTAAAVASAAAAVAAAGSASAMNAAAAGGATAGVAGLDPLQIQRANEQHLAYVRERASAYLKPIVGDSSTFYLYSLSEKSIAAY